MEPWTTGFTRFVDAGVRGDVDNLPGGAEGPRLLEVRLKAWFLRCVDEGIKGDERKLTDDAEGPGFLFFQ